MFDWYAERKKKNYSMFQQFLTHFDNCWSTAAMTTSMATAIAASMSTVSTTLFVNYLILIEKEAEANRQFVS